MLNPYADIAPGVAADPTFAGAPDTTIGWNAVRRVFLQDTPLHERTFKWLATLPPKVRPMATARQYPRIVNRIGDLWTHCEYTRLFLQSLLNDRRGGRRGLPAVIRRELEALQLYYFEHLSGLPAVLWNAVPLAEPKIPKKVFAPISRNTMIEILPVYAGL
jgi:hypothetical protein